MRIFRFIEKIFTENEDFAVSFSILLWIALGSLHSLWMNIGWKGIILGICLHILFLIVVLMGGHIIETMLNNGFFSYVVKCWKESK